MNLIQKVHKNNTHRALSCVDSSIILIANVLVAATLGFIVINMGFSTAQKAKTTISSTMITAGSSLEVE